MYIHTLIECVTSIWSPEKHRGQGTMPDEYSSLQAKILHFPDRLLDSTSIVDNKGLQGDTEQIGRIQGLVSKIFH